MNKQWLKISLGVVCCLAVATSLGCGGGGFSLVDVGSVFQMPWREKPDEMPGVVPPHERIAELREMADSGSHLEPAEQETLSQRLAGEIRQEPDPLIRLEIVRAISTCQTPTADAVIASATEDDSADVRMTACEVLGRRGGPQAVQLLSKTIASDMNADVRLAATKALGATGDPAAVPGLGVALEDSDPSMQYRAVLALKKVTKEDFGQDVALWQAYVRGENPKKPETSIAQRFLNLF